jgi:uncharacterized protein YcfJ
MRPIALIAGVALAVAAAPVAEAACQKRTTGTVVGALTGGLLGNAVAGHGARTEGTLLGAAAGGLVGNQITKCSHRRTYSRARSYPRTHSASRAQYEPSRYAYSGGCRYETRALYDPYGRLVYQPMRVCGR